MSDKKTPVKGQSIALAVVALLTGILFGIVATHLFSGDNQVVDNDGDSISQAETDLRSNLSALAVEHVGLMAEYQQAVYENDGRDEALSASLDESAEELAATIDAASGGDDQEEFMDLWDEVHDSLEEYMVAARDGDAEDVASSRETASEEANEWAAYMVEISSMEAEESLEEDARQLADDWLQMTDSYVAGNYQESYESRSSVVEQVRSFSDALADALVEQHPEAF